MNFPVLSQAHMSSLWANHRIVLLIRVYKEHFHQLNTNFSLSKNFSSNVQFEICMYFLKQNAILLKTITFMEENTQKFKKKV